MIALSCVCAYLLSCPIVYWAAFNAASVFDIPDSLFLVLAILYAPFLILLQIPPTDTIFSWYWELFLPPLP